MQKHRTGYKGGGKRVAEQSCREGSGSVVKNRLALQSTDNAVEPAKPDKAKITAKEENKVAAR